MQFLIFAGILRDVVTTRHNDYSRLDEEVEKRIHAAIEAARAAAGTDEFEKEAEVEIEQPQQPETAETVEAAPNEEAEQQIEVSKESDARSNILSNIINTFLYPAREKLPGLVFLLPAYRDSTPCVCACPMK